METGPRLSPLSTLFEARHKLREYYPELETTLIELIGSLPEDDFCHHARESVSLGAGYAYLERKRSDSEDQWLHVFRAFFDMQPQNRYLDEITIHKNTRDIIKAALDWSSNNEPPELDPAIDQYTVEALVAFIEGFVVTKDYFAEQSNGGWTHALESA